MLFKNVKIYDADNQRFLTGQNVVTSNGKIVSVGKALPKLRLRVEKDLKRRDLTREAVLAAVVRLLDRQHIRIGNEEYARENKSFGATTLRSRHLKRTGHGLMMRFTGKHGIIHEVKITDTNLKRICRRCQRCARAG